MLPLPTQEVVCALCGPDAPFRVILPERLAHDDITFSARRAPNRLHYRVVGCDVCGVVFSNPIYPEDVLIEQYRDAEYIMEEQTSNYLVAYREEFMQTLEAMGKIDSLLEVGCADGLFFALPRTWKSPAYVG